jgi:glucokinase
MVARLAIAVDLGGTNVRAAIVERDGEIRHLVSRPTLGQEGPGAVIDRVAALVGEVVAHETPGQDVAVGVVAPGTVDSDTGIVYYGPNIRDWHDIHLRDILAASLNRTILIGNDANAAALGEARFGSDEKAQHLIYIGLGTGVGGGVISHGQLITGKRGFGGELGHVTIDPNGPRCSCGGIGCIESYVGGWAIVRDGQLLVQSLRSETLRRLAESGPITPEMVAQAALTGDPAAKAIFDRAGRALAVGLGGLINTFNPEVIVIGGGLSKAGDLILKPFREALPSYTLPSIYDEVTIRLSSLEMNTGIYGAAALVFYAQERDPGIV